jgi:putative transposase
MPDPSHLKRLTRVWIKDAVYFITTTVADRRSVLANPACHQIIVSELSGMSTRYGWCIGQYVVMPDHVHFFAKAIPSEARPLNTSIGKWKEWTAKRIRREIGGTGSLWQPEFFDHVLRSNESRKEKWSYVGANPVRAGRVSHSDDWPFAGFIDFN